MLRVFRSLLGSLERVGQRKNEDVALATIYCMFLSFILTWFFAILVIAL